ncbi:hypothetical protein ABT160_29885 [Streptomyces sp. NPDC001941]|uniref:hypothetical protein n=1 Tax=Streptomyces sp. NPDC001941 TaxID=3154659 RepID=UPI0033196B6B
MSEQPTLVFDGFPAWLAEQGEEAYALVWVAGAGEPAGFAKTEVPRAGESGIARPGADLTRIRQEDLTRGRAATLRRWLELDEGTRPLAILSSERGVLREHTPGELAAALMRDLTGDEARLGEQLAGWFSRRNALAPQGLEDGWIAAAAAWTCHMRLLGGYPPPSVLAASLQRAGELDSSAGDLVVSTGVKVGGILDRLERAYRTRSELVEDWHAVEPLAAEVPALAPVADWLLDQVALRDAAAQQLRAVLEPDLTDYLRDRHAGSAPAHSAPDLDAPRAGHLAQARETVRAYTAAAYSGRESDARQLLDAFPVPGRSLSVSGPAAAWREHSATAADAVEDLAAQRAAAAAETSTDYFADPELLHAAASYLAAREGQLHLVHDALGRLVFPAPLPRDLPEALTPVAAAQSERRVIEAFGTVRRAGQAVDGQLTYQSQRPLCGRRHDTADTESGLLTRAHDALERIGAAGAPLDEEDIRARLREAMARPAVPAATTPRALTGHPQAPDHGRSAGPHTTTPGAAR